MAKVGGVLAWHPEVAMSQAEIDEFLSGRWVARLATIGRDGYPHGYPFWYYCDGENIYLTPTPKRASYSDLEANPRCSDVIYIYDRPLIAMRAKIAKR